MGCIDYVTLVDRWSQNILVEELDGKRTIDDLGLDGSITL
jgi:hypothetical protein